MLTLVAIQYASILGLTLNIFHRLMKLVCGYAFSKVNLTVVKVKGLDDLWSVKTLEKNLLYQTRVASKLQRTLIYQVKK